MVELQENDLALVIGMVKGSKYYVETAWEMFQSRRLHYAKER